MHKQGNRAEQLIWDKTRELKTIQMQDTAHSLEDEVHIKEEVHALMEQEDLKWKQRAKENWFKHGDCNTKYFHACTNQRSRGN